MQTNRIYNKNRNRHGGVFLEWTQFLHTHNKQKKQQQQKNNQDVSINRNEILLFLHKGADIKMRNG